MIIVGGNSFPINMAFNAIPKIAPPSFGIKMPPTTTNSDRIRLSLIAKRQLPNNH